MALFESLLILLIVSVLLLKLAKKTQIPYPVLLAFAGMCIGALPNSPAVKIEPHLALAIFVSPAIFDAAFDTSRHQLRKNWLPLFSLVVCAVLLTTAAVAYVGVAFAGLPLAAAIALGAIVAPPDAAAVKEVTREAKLPQNTAVVLQGESLLNDAVAIMIYGVAVDIATQGDSISQALPRYLFSFPGALIFGWVVARGYMLVRPIVTKSLSAILLEFGSVFAVWIAAEHLHLSSILAVVVYAFTIAKYVPEKQGARDRIYSYSVWEAVVFLLNVSAFLILGLHAKSLLERIRGDELVRGLEFAGLVLLTVIVVRVVWVLAFTKFERMTIGGPSKRISFVVSWCGVRGLVTLATAFALPGNFPQRDLLALTAFTVVLGTMIIQGTTLIPLIKFLKLEEEHDPSESELRRARIDLLNIGLDSLADMRRPEAEYVYKEIALKRDLQRNSDGSQQDTGYNVARREAIKAQRSVLAAWRREGKINDDTYHTLEEDLDWAELGASPEAMRQLEI